MCAVINMTPDSFSGDGLAGDAARALRLAQRLRRQGADFLDVGGESSRPGAEPVCARTEKARVLPFIKAFRAQDAVTPLSVDTYKKEVAEAALNQGADIVNDITALAYQPEKAELIVASGAHVILMHMRGTPRTMQQRVSYRNAVTEVKDFLARRAEEAIQNGIPPERIMLDPGIGFGKTLPHNLELIRNLPALRRLGFPVLVGLSRKRFLGQITGRAANRRDWATAAAVSFAAVKGADVVRVHNAAAMRDAVRVADALGRRSEVSYFICLGSNLGEREAYLRKALEAMENEGIYVAWQSRLYETAPLDLKDQPPFLNQVVKVSTLLQPAELLRALQAIEHRFGRTRSVPKGPRTLDLDILLGPRSVKTAGLTLPHPRLHRRAFVLVPLSEYDPDLPVGGGRTVRACLRGVRGQKVKPWKESCG